MVGESCSCLAESNSLVVPKKEKERSADRTTNHYDGNQIVQQNRTSETRGFSPAVLSALILLATFLLDYLVLQALNPLIQISRTILMVS